LFASGEVLRYIPTIPDARVVETATMSKPYNAKWNQNEKLAKTSGEEYNIIGFGLPPDYNFVDASGTAHNTCPGALACAGVCYAKQGGYRYPNSIAARDHNLAFSQSDGFVAGIVSDLRRKRKINTVRIHDSGDFYSQEYFDKWCAIARALPRLTFYAYTKSLHLDLTGAPVNFKVTQSLGGKYDAGVNLAASHSRIFSTHEDRERAGYIDGNIDDSPAIRGLVQIGLVYHGNKNLTASQKKFFA
jgi:hypothetical protein